MKRTLFRTNSSLFWSSIFSFPSTLAPSLLLITISCTHLRRGNSLCFKVKSLGRRWGQWLDEAECEVIFWGVGQPADFSWNESDFDDYLLVHCAWPRPTGRDVPRFPGVVSKWMMLQAARLSHRIGIGTFYTTCFTAELNVISSRLEVFSETILRGFEPFMIGTASSVRMHPVAHV